MAAGAHPQEPALVAPSSEPIKTQPEPQPSNTVPDPPVVKGNLPYAKPVSGKPGFVISPYDKDKGHIDVRGIPPGTEVTDPYSGKTFLVP